MLSEIAECSQFLVSVCSVDDGYGILIFLQASIHPQFTDNYHFGYGSLTVDDHIVTTYCHWGLQNSDTLSLFLMEQLVSWY